MNEGRLMDQLKAIFGIFMTLFYIGFGLFIAFSQDRFQVTTYKPLWNIIGFTFILYGAYRAYRTYQQIVEVFFTGRDNEK